MFGFTSSREVPIPIEVDSQLLESVHRRFRNAEHFWEVLERIDKYLETSADPVLHWGAEEAILALHIFVSASSQVGKQAPIQTDHVFRKGRELFGTTKRELSARQRELLAKAELLQVIALKCS